MPRTTDTITLRRVRLQKYFQTAALALALLPGVSAVCTAQAAALSAQDSVQTVRYPWMPDRGDGTYSNPVIFADYSDPDVIRAGDRFIMVSSSFAQTPALPVLSSQDCVNWRIVGHCIENLPSRVFDRVQHGKGVWAPSVRYHRGAYYVYYGDPDLGICMTKARAPSGPWAPAVCVKEAKGWIDPCPLWDEDGNAYLVHGWAKSRAGFNSVLTVNRMNAEGTKILDEGRAVFDGHAKHPTIEGPKFYKRNGWYYIFAPAGGVKPGWQTVLRSRSVYGPYEDRIVMDQGRTHVNGPHQGAWVRTAGGEDWFIHFQDRGAYGRIVHLEPMAWKDDWPVIGRDSLGSGTGEPVGRHTKPAVKKNVKRSMPQTSDDFSERTLGLQWQWEANHQSGWFALRARKGLLRLISIAADTSEHTLWDAPNLLLQKFPAEAFTASTRIDCSGLKDGERAGLVVFGRDYAALAVRNDRGRLVLERVTCMNADRGQTESVDASAGIARPTIDLRVEVDAGAQCRFSYSADGQQFLPLGPHFTAREGVWVGAKIGIFARAPGRQRANGYADFDFFQFK